MPSQWLAVEAETDPLTRARQLQTSWERLLAEGALGPELPPEATAGLRPAIVESWRRSLATGLDPTELVVPIEADQAEARERWLEHPLGSLEHVIAAQLRDIAEESQSLVVVTDASGVLLHIDGSDWLKERAREMNFLEGARLSEAVDGTNGIGTALAADHALQVFAFEHFNQRHHQWICSGAPVHDPLSGRIVGLIDLSSLWKIAHPRSLELVTTAARTIERCLLANRRDQDARLRRRYGDLMTRSADLLVNRDGYLLDGDEPAHPTPFEIPKGGGEIVLDDGSVAVAEPLGQGEAYLVRRASRRAESAPVVALERVEVRARELATEQAALRQVATLVARDSSPDQLFTLVAEQVARVFDVPLVRLVRYEPDCSVVLGGFSKGNDDPFPIGSRWPLDSSGVIASVRQSGRPARVDDYAQMSGSTAAAVRQSGMRSAVGSPIVVEGRLWGAMVIASPRREPLPADTEARLTDFTELVATAIANAESRVAIGRLADEQAALRRVATLVASNQPPDAVFAAVAREVAHVFEVGLTTVCRFERDAIVVLSSFGVPAFPAGSRWPLEVPSLTRTIRETGGPARIDDFTNALGLDALARDAGVKAAAGAPILVGGSVFGSINIASTNGRPFPADTEARLAAFTELVSTAISNVEARRKLERIATEQEALRTAATLVASGASPTEVFAQITTSASEVFGAPFASLIRSLPDGTATMVAGCQACSAYVGTSWEVPEDDPGITRTVVKTGRPARIEDHSRVYGPVGEAARALGLGSVVGAPVVVDGAIWGVLAVGAPQDGPPLALDVGERLAGFTELVTTTLINAESREEVRSLLTEQETLRRVATLIAEGASPDAVFVAVCDEAAALFDSEMAAVGRFEVDEPALVTVGLSAGVRGMTIGMRTELEDWLASTAVYRTGRTARRDVTAEEVTSTGPIADAVRAMGFLSTVSAPIVVEGRLWGVMTVSDSRHALARDTEMGIESFTELIATAIANRETRDQVTRLVDEQSSLRRVATLVAESPVSEELFSAVAQEVAGVLNVSGVLVERFEPDGSVLTLGTAYDADLEGADAFFAVGILMPRDPGSLAAQVFETGRTAQVDDYSRLPGAIGDAARAAGLGSGVAGPILVDGELWGQMCVFSRAGTVLPVGTENRLHDFIELVATAISNYEAHVALERLADEQAALRRIATLVAGGATPDRVFEAVRREVVRMFGLARSVLMRYDADGAATLVATDGEWLGPVGRRWPLETDDSSVARVRATGRAARVDYAVPRRGAIAEIAASAGVRHAVAVPILVEGGLWGAMSVATTDPEPLPLGIEGQLAKFTELLATAIANAESRGELAASEARKSAILESALDCIITIDREGKIIEFNPAAEATFGYRRKDVLGKEMAGLIIPPELREQHYSGLVRYLETGEGPLLGKRLEVQALRSDGTEFPVELTITPITVGDHVMFTGQIRDVTDRKRGEEERARLLSGEQAARSEAEAARERAQDLAREQAALRRVAVLVAKGASPDELFSAVAEEVARIIGIPIVRVHRFEADGTFTVVGIAGETNFTVGSRWPVPEDGIAGMILTTGRPAHKDDYSTMRGPLGDALRQDLTTSTVGVPIVVEGSIWGFMVADGRPGRPIPPDTEQRLARFTELVATAVSNATNRTDLLTSRARLVSTADETRRRLERDLHDGIQQWLVALALKARKAAALSGAGGPVGHELSDLADDLVAVTDELREISRGIHPAILSDAGLDDALEALARRSAIRVDLDVDFQGRYHPTLEATVYYLVAESITNAVKHAQASAVTVRGGLRDGAIELEITDDGVGGADPRRGTGMIGLKDRVETLGGTISFASPAGAGTTIRVSLPARPHDADDPVLRESDEAASAPASG